MISSARSLPRLWASSCRARSMPPREPDCAARLSWASDSTASASIALTSLSRTISPVSSSTMSSGSMPMIRAAFSWPSWTRKMAALRTPLSASFWVARDICCYFRSASQP